MILQIDHRPHLISWILEPQRLVLCVMPTSRLEETMLGSSSMGPPSAQLCSSPPPAKCFTSTRSRSAAVSSWTPLRRTGRSTA
uniref:Uncharacterized protein n=1 Tax=Zea mays TaxID=4577 RepID=C4J323_MAIZE|nr:unknown [Zea mays]